MDTDTYHLLTKVHLQPIWHRDPPSIVLMIDDYVIHSGSLRSDTVFTSDLQLSSGDHCLTLIFDNKNDHDTVPESGLDKAVVIAGIEFNHIQSPRFVWNGKYQPRYPQTWFQEQMLAGIIPPDVLENSTYLGWNGVWKLNFSVPIFTWIHCIENLGWIHHL